MRVFHLFGLALLLALSGCASAGSSWVELAGTRWWGVRQILVDPEAGHVELAVTVREEAGAGQG